MYHDFMGTCSARMVAISSAASSASCPDVIVAAVGMVDAVGGVVCFGVEREVAAEGVHRWIERERGSVGVVGGKGGQHNYRRCYWWTQSLSWKSRSRLFTTERPLLFLRRRLLSLRCQMVGVVSFHIEPHQLFNESQSIAFNRIVQWD